MAERERRDFLIVGAGPAGLAAALEAARAGVDTCIVDLRPRHAFPARRLREMVAAGVEVRVDTSAWGIWGRTVATCPAGGRAERISAEHVLLATGARPRPVVFPGWQLPGVLWSSAVDVSGRVVVAGSGPDLASRAAELQRRGVDVRAVVDATSGQLLVRAEGVERVERAVVARVDANWQVQPATESTSEADTILLDYGQVPCSELTRLSGCTHVRRDVDTLVPVHDEWMRTDVPGVLVAGDLCGVVGPDVAAEQGRLAGIAVALALGHIAHAEAERLAKPVRVRVQQLTVERDRHWSAYRVGHGIFELARPDTVVCHCENVTVATIQAAVLDSSPDPAPVRAETRAGMGVCQARDCGRQIEALVAQAAGVPLESVPPLSVRPPVVPIPLGAIAERPPELA